MNKSTVSAILVMVFGHTTFTINSGGIALVTDGIGNVKEVKVKGRGRNGFTIAYNYGTDAFDCTDSKREIEGLYINQLVDFIKLAK